MAFSLIEMMIAIVILGLGLVMTATMFPVAWTRARTLTEYSTQRSVTSSAESTLSTLLHAAGPSVRVVSVNGNPTRVSLLSAGSLAGDLFYDPVLHTDPQFRLPPGEIHRCVLLPSDTRVHALNLQNVRSVPDPSDAKDPWAVAENPWRLERNDPWRLGITTDICEQNYPWSNNPAWLSADFCADRSATPPNRYGPSSFYSPQVAVASRVYPPLTSLPPSDATSANARAKWNDKLSTRRFAWAVLHRLRNLVGPDVNKTYEKAAFAAQAAEASGTTRVFDMYIVTLRRTQPSNRYARQEWDAPTSLPDPANRDVVVPMSRPAGDDVLLPTPWRVQIELPLTLALRSATPGAVGAPTGVPTEVQFPPTAAAFAGVDARSRFSQMLPGSTQFVDEVNGQVYRVVKRREGLPGTPTDGFAFLTLDREIVVEDVDDSPEFGGDFAIQPDDTIRTVWVFPPAVDRSLGTDEAPVFDGSSPVVGIDVRTVSLSPPG